MVGGNEALKKMLEMAERASQQKKFKEEPIHQEEREEPKLLPSLSDSTNESTFSLSLDFESNITKDVIAKNVAVAPRNLKGGGEKINKARRAVGRLTTGASAAVPLICRGESCPFKAKCVSEFSEIQAPNGNILIKDLLPGDSIYSMSKEGFIEEDTVMFLRYSGTKLTYTIRTMYGLELRVTDDHPVLTEVNGEKIYLSIKNGLRHGSTVYIIDNELLLNINTMSYGDVFEDVILSIEPYKEERVYDITVQKNSNFFANCIQVHNCPYYLEGIHQVGENCLVEEQLIEYWTHKYLTELDIDYNSISEMHMLSRLVEITIMDLRMTNYMSINDQDLMMDFVSSIDPNGSAITNKGVSVAFEVKERLEKQKLKILDTLNSTRDKKAKLSIQAESKESSISAKGFFEKLDSIASNLENLKANEVRPVRI